MCNLKIIALLLANQKLVFFHLYYYIIGCKSNGVDVRAFFKDFPVGGGAFFEKGPFCEIIY
jgi:hypothetical protein